MDKQKKIVAILGLVLAASVFLPWSSVGVLPLSLILSPVRAAPVLVLGLAAPALMLTGDRDEEMATTARVIVTACAAFGALYAGSQAAAAASFPSGAMLALCASVLLLVCPWWRGKI